MFRLKALVMIAAAATATAAVACPMPSLPEVQKGSGGTDSAAIVAFPDVCKTPEPGGPVPLPYPNPGVAEDGHPGTKKIEIGGGLIKADRGYLPARPESDFRNYRGVPEFQLPPYGSGSETGREPALPPIYGLHPRNPHDEIIRVDDPGFGDGPLDEVVADEPAPAEDVYYGRPVEEPRDAFGRPWRSILEDEYHAGPVGAPEPLEAALPETGGLGVERP